ncbi:MAG: hypothetical protein ABF968_14130, partial [Acetobacter sp.]
RRGMQPTLRAIAMAEPLQGGVALIHTAFSTVTAFDPTTSRQHFSIGMSDDFQIAIGPLIARRLAEEAPRVSVTFRQANTHRVEALFEAGESTLLLSHNQMCAPDYSSRRSGGPVMPACLIPSPAALHCH